MKRNSIFLLLLFFSINGYSQYIGVKARYTETRQVDDAPNPPKRENHLVLSFFEVTVSGQYIPVSLTNYDLWVYTAGLQYGSDRGGVLDSSGNNYSGYNWPAPRAVAYFNTLGLNYIDCYPNTATHYVVNGHELDCGFVTVSYWDIDYGTLQPIECFPAPNVCLPYYQWPHSYAFAPGNVNFSWPEIPPGPPYNWYSSNCGGGVSSFVIRGVLPADTSTILVTLPVKFANVRGEINAFDNARTYWSNMTESNILQYEVERSADGVTFQSIGMILPLYNTGGRADYTFSSIQPDDKDYYRIKATETTAGFFYSTIINLTKTDKPPLFSVFPNPVTSGQLNFRLTNADDGNYFCYLLNSASQSVKQKQINHTGGDIISQLDVTGLPRGIYQLVLQSSTQRFSKQILVNY